VPEDKLYAKTTGFCFECGSDVPAAYRETGEGMDLETDCPRHGKYRERVEKDTVLFRWGYEQEYVRRARHLALPVTYRCNLRCRYCYTLSNDCASFLPADRSRDTLLEHVRAFGGNVTLIGGEPTVRRDLPDLIRACRKIQGRRKLSVATNGQRIADPGYLEELYAAGLDFVFLSLNDPAYDGTDGVWEHKMKALENCAARKIPVWLQRTVDDLAQIDSLFPVLRRYKRVIFTVTLRAAKPIGLNNPDEMIYLSDLIKYLGKENDVRQGTSPFNRYVTVENRPVKVCSWVPDIGRLAPIDSFYLISDNTVTTFHRGMYLDEILLKSRRGGSADRPDSEPCGVC